MSDCVFQVHILNCVESTKCIKLLSSFTTLNLPRPGVLQCCSDQWRDRWALAAVVRSSHAG